MQLWGVSSPCAQLKPKFQNVRDILGINSILLPPLRTLHERRARRHNGNQIKPFHRCLYARCTFRIELFPARFEQRAERSVHIVAKYAQQIAGFRPGEHDNTCYELAIHSKALDRHLMMY